MAIPAAEARVFSGPEPQTPLQRDGDCTRRSLRMLEALRARAAASLLESSAASRIGDAPSLCRAAAGLDFSHRFVATAELLRGGGSLSYLYTVEGETTASAVATLPAESRASAERVRFLQGDACALPSADALGGAFHILHAANLLCRLPNPA